MPLLLYTSTPPTDQATFERYTTPPLKSLVPHPNGTLADHADARAVREVIALAPSLASSDAAVLPFKLDWYLMHGRAAEVHALARAASVAGRWLLAWHDNDHPPLRVPASVLLLPYAARASGLRPGTFARPAQMTRDLLMDANGGTLTVRPRQARPTVGFCGQATFNLARLAYYTAQNACQHLSAWAGVRAVGAPPLWPPQALRARLLRRLTSHPAVQTDFVAVEMSARKYAPDAWERRRFIDNVRNTDYTLCVRGAGNYSIRFYETLCLGRIPLYVDTDTVLPFPWAIDWRRHVVWVAQGDADRIQQVLLDFHASIHPDDFAQMQHANRALWLERLSTVGFLRHLHEIVAHAGTPPQ